MTTWFTSDTHFGHKNIVKYDNRPFSDIVAMDDGLIKNINDLVQPNDILYHLGDFAFGGEQAVINYRDRINCKNVILIYGNHDKSIRRMHFSTKQRLFVSIHELLETKVEGQSITLCHYSMRVWNKSHHGSWHLYGHSHGSLPDDPNSRSFDVGINCHDYKPLSLDDVSKIMSKKTWRPIDHHV